MLTALLLLLQALAPVGQETWVLDEVLRVGAFDGLESLTRIRGAALTEDLDYLVIGQSMAKKLLVIDTETGGVVRPLGQTGAGPGEFQDVSFVSVVGDTVAGLDLQQRRVVLFSLDDGSHIETKRAISPPFEETGRPAFPRALTSDGGYWGVSMTSSMRVANDALDQVPIVLMDDSAGIVRVVAQKRVAGTIGFADLGGRVLVYLQRLVRPMVDAYAPDGSSMVLVENRTDGSAAVRRFDQRGDVIYARDLPLRPRRVEPETRDSIYDWFAEMVSEGGGPAARRVARSHVTMPDYLPAVSHAIVDPDGGAWLRSTGTRSWIVLDPRGNTVASVRSPQGVDLLVVRGSQVWGVWRDELDVPYLVRYRVRRGPG